MAVCTFFGHRDCPDTVKEKLREALIDLIEHHGVSLFYVGNQGNFDAIVRSVLGELKKHYPHIDYGVVLAYMPENKKRIRPDFRCHRPGGAGAGSSPVCHFLAERVDAETV